MIRIAALFLTAIFLQGTPAARQSGQSSKSGESVIDLAECMQQTKVTYSKFGSEKIVVKGRRGSRCVIERTSEMEGSYVTRECRIPVSRGKLKLVEKPGTAAAAGAADKNQGQCAAAYLGDVTKYCKVIKTGNVLLQER
jgi:hypothetical protein